MTDSALTAQQKTALLLRVRHDAKNAIKGNTVTQELIQKISDELEGSGLFEGNVNDQGPGDPLLEEVFDLVICLMWTIGAVGADLLPIYEKLIRLKLSLKELEKSSSFTGRHLIPYQDELRKVDEVMHEGRIISKSPNASSKEIQGGQAMIFSLVHQCHRLITKMLIDSENISPALQPLETQLATHQDALIRLLESQKTGSHLEKAIVKDLNHIKDVLLHIDCLRVDGRFYDVNGGIPEGQGVVIGLLEHCYELVNEIQATFSSEDDEKVAPALLPLYNELRAIYATLSKLEGWSIPLVEITQLQKRLDAVDSQRQDGRFKGDGGKTIPAGQGALHFLLAASYEKVHRLLVTASPLGIEEEFLPIYDELLEVISTLKKTRRRDYNREVLTKIENKLSSNVEQMKCAGILYGGDDRGQACRAMLRCAFSRLYEVYEATGIAYLDPSLNYPLAVHAKN